MTSWWDHFLQTPYIHVRISHYATFQPHPGPTCPLQAPFITQYRVTTGGWVGYACMHAPMRLNCTQYEGTGWKQVIRSKLESHMIIRRYSVKQQASGTRVYQLYLVIRCCRRAALTMSACVCVNACMLWGVHTPCPSECTVYTCV